MGYSKHFSVLTPIPVSWRDRTESQVDYLLNTMLLKVTANLVFGIYD